MRSPMDQETFLSFFKNTIVGCSNSLLKNICNLLEEQKRITFEQQRSYAIF